MASPRERPLNGVAFMLLLATPNRQTHEQRQRDTKLIGYSDRTRYLIHRACELNPILEEAIINLADSAHADSIHDKGIRNGTNRLIGKLLSLEPGLTDAIIAIAASAYADGIE